MFTHVILVIDLDSSVHKQLHAIRVTVRGSHHQNIALSLRRHMDVVQREKKIETEKKEVNVVSQASSVHHNQ